MITCGIVVHGGVGSPKEWSEGCDRAAARGRRALDLGGTALEAVLEAAVELEDDGRFNAGRGSCLRLDGKTIEMDAALMTSRGEMGAVAAVQRLKNPILAAREVMKTPHVLLSGEGALAFARRCGLPEQTGVSDTAKARYAKVRDAVKAGRTEEFRAAWRGFDLKGKWNFAAPYEEVFAACDTIGAVAVDREGLFAVANSTGGAVPMLAGRIGDSPLPGCGFYAGPAGAVAATGIGEEIIRRMICRQVHEWIASGEEVARACDRAVALFPSDVPVGVIAISRRGRAVASNRDMASGEQVTE
jgi:isoaspartyl peptidase/L-asparaginase-like protein (Ntn-hydrolase superfamily)